MEIILLIIYLLICLISEGFFSGSEIAFVNADKYKLIAAKEAGSKRAHMAYQMISDSATFLSTTLLGTNVSTVSGSVLVTLYIIKYHGDMYAPLAILYLPFSLILGEIVPKSVYQAHADKIVLRIAPILFFFSYLFYPITWVLSRFTNSILRKNKNRQMGLAKPLSREELELMIEVKSRAESDVKQYERRMISHIFDLAEKRVENIMTPLVDIISANIYSQRDEVERVLENYEFSRIPVYEGKSFNIVGILHSTDLIFSDSKQSIKDLMIAPLYVPEEMPLDELFVNMRTNSHAMAIAVDEYGAATGIVTNEDLIEEVVGEIADEHDETPLLYRRMGRNQYRIYGRTEIEHIRSMLDIDIPEGGYETIAGFVLHEFGHIPKIGESFLWNNYEFTIVRATERVVLEVDVKWKK